MLDDLDKKAEFQPLQLHELDLRHHLKDRLTKLLREEEIKWLQCSKTSNLLQGDGNTKFFHLVANGRQRKARICKLEHEDGVIEGNDDLKRYITKYYKDLFGSPEENHFSLDESRRDDIPQVSNAENELLTACFSDKEVKETIFQMELNKSSGPDGFPAEFYQTFWEIIKKDLMSLFNDFHNKRLPLFSLNFGIITLLYKKSDAIQIQQYRPICLLNVSFKVFTKALTNRLSVIAQNEIRPTQSAFMPGRFIMEGVVVLHESIHEMHRKKVDGVILKLDFEKAYDKVKWSLLQQTLRMKSFSLLWCAWIDQVVSRGSVGMNVNDDIGYFFRLRKVLDRETCYLLFCLTLLQICWPSLSNGPKMMGNLKELSLI